MLIVGHTALAYILVRPILALDKSSIKPVNIFFIFIFANIIDFINFSIFIYFTHTLLGIFIFSLFWLLFFYKFEIIEKRILPLFLLATCSQVIGDYLFSKIYFFAPIINTRYSVYGYDHLIGHFADSILFVIFLIIFIITKDHQQMREFIHNEKNRFFKSFKLKNIFNSELYIFYLFIAFYLFSIGQFIHFFNNNLSIMRCNPIVWAYLLCFILFLGLLTYIGIGKIPKDNQQKTNTK